MQFLLELDYIYLMYTMREFWGVIFTSWTERIENKFLKDERGMPFVFYLKKIITLLINYYILPSSNYLQVSNNKKETEKSMLFWSNDSLTFNIIFC